MLPVLYIHGATFPSALSVGFDFGNGSWLDDWNARGFDAWAFDFAGFGESGRYAAMSEPADRHPPLGRAPEAAQQVADVVALIQRETSGGAAACRWSRIPGAARRRALATIAMPEAIDRLVLFAPIARRTGGTNRPRCRRGVTFTNRGAVRPLRRGRAEGPSAGARRLRPLGAGLSRERPRRRATYAARRAHPNGPRADNIDTWAGRASGIRRGSRGRWTIVRGAWNRSAATPMRR